MTNSSDGGKSILTRIKSKLLISNNLVQLLYRKEQLSNKDAEYLFSVSLALINEFENHHEKYLFIEYAYMIIATTCFKINDFRALYDFSVNYGYYPIARKIIGDNLIKDLTINHLISNIEIDDFVDSKKVKTYEQNKIFNEVLFSEEQQLSFIAPTSYGKSELIFKHLQNNSKYNFVAIIVPTKALIDQTYREAKKHIKDRKLIIHDQNYVYEKDKRVLAIVTQERALRLIEEGMIFELLYIDEAHELLNFNYRYKLGNRSLLLARFIQLSRQLNNKLKMVYLSPTIQEVDNLVLNEQPPIIPYKIKKDLKILDIKFLDKQNKEFIYDRFLNEFIEIQVAESALDYIYKTSINYNKNLHFLYRPRNIEDYSEKLFAKLPQIEVPLEIEKLCEELKSVVHPNFKLIKYFSKGIVYMHGRLPLIIRNYLLKHIRESAFLQHFIANSVVLAGMNLPIDNLIYISGFKNQSDLQNLIGRVNRLNEIFKNGTSLSKIFIPVHFVEMNEYPQQNGKGKLKTKIESLRGKPTDLVKNPILKNSSNSESAEKIRENESKILREYDNPDFFTRISKAGAQQIINYTDTGIEKLKLVIENSAKINGNENLYEKLLYKIKEIFFEPFLSNGQMDESYFSPTNNSKRLRYTATLDYYTDFLNFSFKTLHERVDNLYNYWQEILNGQREGSNFVYVGPQFGEVSYETESYVGQAQVYVDLRQHTNDEEFLYNLAIIKIQTDEDFIGHEITLLLGTLKEFEIITEAQFNYFLYRTFDKKELDILRLGISKNIYQLLKDDNQIENIYFDEFGNARANSNLKEYINTKVGIEKFELEQYFL